MEYKQDIEYLRENQPGGTGFAKQRTQEKKAQREATRQQHIKDMAELNQRHPIAPEPNDIMMELLDEL